MSLNHDFFMLDLFEQMIMLGIPNQDSLKILSDYDTVVEEFKTKVSTELLAEGLKTASVSHFSKEELRMYFEQV